MEEGLHAPVREQEGRHGAEEIDAPPPAAAVSLKGVSKTYRTGLAALDGIDLAVAPGSFLGILGPSGCGKSTLLRIIAGLAEPTAGRREVTLSGARQEIGFVFQEPTLMPWATVADNVYLPLRLAGMRRAKAAPLVAEALSAVGLDGFAHSYPRELSGGMRMRVSIARAFVTRPRLLLLDEPFAALDEITRFRLNEDLLRLWRTQGWTIVFVTHSVFESVFLSSRVVVMTPRPGRIAADIPIDLPHPRDAALRTGSAYNEQCRVVSQRLAAAMKARR